MIFMYAILLHGQFMTFNQPYIIINDLLFISCFCMVVNPGYTKWSQSSFRAFLSHGVLSNEQCINDFHTRNEKKTFS